MDKPDALKLEVTEFTDADHWRWSLLDTGGQWLADHHVNLQPNQTQHAALIDLAGYVKQFAAPDRQWEDEARIIREVGAWLGVQLLGPIADAILDYGTPLVVRVVVPEAASRLLHLPLELAHAKGKPLAVQDVALVFEVEGEAPAVRAKPVEGKLRVLAAFSLPTDASVLDLRRERYELRRLIQRIVQMQGLAIDLRVLQYGVTRRVLQDTLEEGEGWDVVHFSGHGLPARLLLEREDGTRDLIGSDEFVRLLHPARGRLKLVTLFSCLSAAPAVGETLRWLGISPQVSLHPPPVGPSSTRDLAAVARALVRELDCAVLAMRYPLADEFAISFAEGLYERLIGKGQPISRALNLALGATLQGSPSASVPPLSVAAPALFGRRAVDLVLKAPRSSVVDFRVPLTGLSNFPPEPERFVGRVGQLLRCSAALGPSSGKTGVLLHGMVGGGKSSCALELAYGHETGRFQAFVWYRAPEEGKDVSVTLRDVALAMERQLPGFKMLHVIDRHEEFMAWLPRLKELLEKKSILIVIDNLETLLTPDGKWRDNRLDLLVKGLIEHHGLSRVVMTSRLRPSSLGQEKRLHIETISALSLGEAALMARQLPNLGRLLRGESQFGRERGRELVSRMLRVVQGHPKLIEFAESLAADPRCLANQLHRITDLLRSDDTRLRAFFEDGVSGLDAAEFLESLTAWTQSISETLPQPARVLFHFLCSLEEQDREGQLVNAVWLNLWRRLNLPQVPELLPMTAETLAAVALVDPQPKERNGVLYVLHPGVAEAGRAQAGLDFQIAVDEELARFWVSTYSQALRQEGRGGGPLLLRAGLGAAPYLARLKRWHDAGVLLAAAMRNNDSPDTTAALLPLLRRIVAETRGMESELGNILTLVEALRMVGQWGEAERMSRDVMSRAAERCDFHTASSAAGYLIWTLMDTGGYEEALAIVETKKDYTRRAGLGLWTQLGDEAQRLRVLEAMGRHDEVFLEAERLQERMRTTPEDSGQTEGVAPWDIREGILSTLASAALQKRQWQKALDLNAQVISAMRLRRAPPTVIAHARFNDAIPLTHLKRYGEARAILKNCLNAFRRNADLAGMSIVFGQMADLESNLGNSAKATDLQKTCLRYAYQVPDPQLCRVAHQDLGVYLLVACREIDVALSSLIAGAMIAYQTGHINPSDGLFAALKPIAELLPKPLIALEVSLDDVCKPLASLAGVRFLELFEGLPRRAASPEAALKVVVDAFLKEIAAMRQPGPKRNAAESAGEGLGT